MLFSQPLFALWEIALHFPQCRNRRAAPEDAQFAARRIADAIPLSREECASALLFMCEFYGCGTQIPDLPAHLKNGANMDSPHHFPKESNNYAQKEGLKYI